MPLLREIVKHTTKILIQKLSSWKVHWYNAHKTGEASTKDLEDKKVMKLITFKSSEQGSIMAHWNITKKTSLWPVLSPYVYTHKYNQLQKVSEHYLHL